MKRSIEEVILVAYVICVYFGLPVAIIAGWIHWAKRRGSVNLPLGWLVITGGSRSWTYWLLASRPFALVRAYMRCGDAYLLGLVGNGGITVGNRRLHS
jgi:hypothetical protein